MIYKYKPIYYKKNTLQYSTIAYRCQGIITIKGGISIERIQRSIFFPESRKIKVQKFVKIR